MIINNKDTVNQHYLDITIKRKNAAPGEEMKFSLLSYITSFSITQALSMKSMFLKATYSDGSGLFDKGFISVGDEIEIILYVSDEDEFKLIKSFYISELKNLDQLENTKHKVFDIHAITAPAYVSSNIFLTKSYKGKCSDIVKDIYKTYLKLPDSEIEVEETSGQIEMVFPKTTPTMALQELTKRAISANLAYQDNLFFSYETAKGHKFKCTKAMISNSTIHTYSQYPNKRPTENSDDYFRILHFEQNEAASRKKLVESGVLNNELVSFNFVDRTITSTGFDYSRDKDKTNLLGIFAPFDYEGLSLQQQEYTTTASSFDKVAHVSYICAEESYQRYDARIKEPTAKAQLEMLRQNTITLKVHGNHQIIPGDVIQLTVPAKYLTSDNQFDTRLDGKYLVAGVRHDVAVGSLFDTIVDLYKDANEVESENRTSNSDNPKPDSAGKEYRFELTQGNDAGAKAFDEFLAANKITIAKGVGG